MKTLYSSSSTGTYDISNNKGSLKGQLNAVATKLGGWDSVIEKADNNATKAGLSSSYFSNNFSEKTLPKSLARRLQMLFLACGGEAGKILAKIIKSMVDKSIDEGGAEDTDHDGHRDAYTSPPLDDKYRKHYDYSYGDKTYQLPYWGIDCSSAVCAALNTAMDIINNDEWKTYSGITSDMHNDFYNKRGFTCEADGTTQGAKISYKIGDIIVIGGPSGSGSGGHVVIVISAGSAASAYTAGWGPSKDSHPSDWISDGRSSDGYRVFRCTL